MSNVTCIEPSLYGHSLTSGRVYTVVAFDYERRRVRVRGDHQRLVWIPVSCFAIADIATLLPQYRIWIEAEVWAPGQWDYDDGNTDVIINFDDGARWAATFITYANVTSLTEKNQHTGECLSGKYLWVADMLLVDKISRERIEEVVQYLWVTGEFAQVFVQCLEP